MPIDVTVTRDIDRPREEVAAFCADPDNDTRWYVNIKEVRWITDRPARVGSRVARVARFLGRDIAYTYEVVEWTPGTSLRMRAIDGPFPMETAYGWEDAGPGRTRMTIRNSGGPEGFFGLASPLLAAQVRRSIEADLTKLARILSAPPA